MVGIFKFNNVETLGGVTPQIPGVELITVINGWQVVLVPDELVSAVQEFGIIPVDVEFAKDIVGPTESGDALKTVYSINGYGDKMRVENNPGQVDSNGNKMLSLNVDEESRYISEDQAKPYKNAYNKLKLLLKKILMRNDIRGNVKDLKDDIADMKNLAQFNLYYFSSEWKSRTDAQRGGNPYASSMNILANKILSDEFKMTLDSTDIVAKIKKIIDEEKTIDTFIANNYKK